jgi:hypothetical protein
MNTFRMSAVAAFTAPVTRGIEILVFKTNLDDTKRVNEVASLLDIHPHIVQWNVDMDDCDKVLRVLSRNIKPLDVEMMLLNAGYYCEELE